jgi:putative FmdB family regulatory protein
MPIYEFKCEACGRRFEELCSIGVDCQKCPQCGSERVVKLISAFAARCPVVPAVLVRAAIVKDVIDRENFFIINSDVG